MALSGKFLADFDSFYAACTKAEVSLRSFETGSGKVETSLNRMANAFSGQRIIQDATLMTEAITRVGGASTLTAAEQARVNATVTEAIAKYAALGQSAPAAMRTLAAETQRVEPAMSLAGKATSILTSAFGQFTAANLAATAIQKLVSGVGEFIEIGVKLPAVQSSFTSLTAGMGQDGALMLANMTKATLGMVSNYDLMLGANKAMLLGLPVTATSMGELAKTATVLGRAMGQDATTSLNDLVTALGRSSPMILDNLGLTVKVGEANDLYAAKLGKTAEQLTDAEKKMAFYEAAMLKAKEKTAELGEQTKTLGEIVTGVMTTMGNVVSQGTATANAGIGLILSSWKEFGQFLIDSHGSLMYFGEALEKAAARAALLSKAGKEVSRDFVAAVDPLDTYSDHLATLRMTVSTLTDEQKHAIVEGARLKDSVSEIATALGLNEKAVQAVIDAEKDRVEMMKKTAAEAKEQAKVLATLDAKTVFESTKLWDDHFARRVALSGTSTGVQIANANREYQDTVAKLTKEGTLNADTAAGAAAVWHDKLAAIGSDWNSVRDQSIGALQASADRALVTYNAMVASGDFYRDALDKQLTKYHELQDAARGYGDTGVDASGRLEAAARHETAELEKQKGLLADLAAARAIGGAFEVTRANFAATARGMGQNEGVIETLLKKGYSFQQALLYAPHPEWPAPQNPGPRVPGFASGVANFSGGPAWVGEQGPELLNLPRGSSITPMSGTSIVNNFYVNGTGQDVARIVLAEITRSMKTGRKWPAA